MFQTGTVIVTDNGDLILKTFNGRREYLDMVLAVGQWGKVTRIQNKIGGEVYDESSTS